ncbi:hypothetical protein Patl1_24481 [Pistacia atlantica]|uniref:Uncharacterized protein n=1 Tax=Pistacia atlantica TaxID=434234 RepID=A0ACC0ZXH4_9ROSI|nr:hypothetical protein Patl1_24481 [Pistacia atlantica]
MAVHLHLHIIILLVWAIKASAIYCPTSCGNVNEIRYPFGIGEGCYFNEWFAVTCVNSSGSPVPFFSRMNLNLSEDISRRSNGMAIGLSVYVNKLEGVNLSVTPFYFSYKLNKFIATGCNNYTTTFRRYRINSTTGNCKSAVMVEQDWIQTNYLANARPSVLEESKQVPVVMEFGRYMGDFSQKTSIKNQAAQVTCSVISQATTIAPHVPMIMKEKPLFEILDARALKDDREQEIMTFVNLTRRCLNLNGRKRPTMREVAMELAGIRTSNRASTLKENCEEIDYVDGDETSSSFAGSFLYSTTFSTG